MMQLINAHLWRSGILTLACLIFATSSAFSAIDRKRMDRDLDIMETVLGRLLKENGESHILDRGADVQGIYFTGYGALFLVDGASSSGDLPHRIRIVSKPGQKEVDYIAKGEAKKDGDTTMEGSRLDEYREPLIEFLGTYADAMAQLQPTDRVTVLIKPGGRGLHDMSFGHVPGLSHLPVVADVLRDLDINADSIKAMIQIEMGDADSCTEIDEEIREEVKDALEEAHDALKDAQSRAREGRREAARARAGARRAGEEARAAGRAARAAVLSFGPGSGGPSNVLLEATVKKTDIDAFSRGSISEKEFEGKITFKERKREDVMPKKIDILADILDRVVESEDHWIPVRESSTNGIYQQGLGVIYFVRPESGYVRYFRSSSEEDEEDKTLRETISADITETLADYGHTLRLLKPDESIICQIDLSGRSHGKSGRMTIRAPMKAINDYRKGKIDLAGFRKRVEILD